MMMKKLLYTFILATISSPAAMAQDAKDSTTTGNKEQNKTPAKRFNLHFQTTYIYQYKPEMVALYSGQNSLKTEEEKQNSVTMTLYFSARLWKGAELYINPEVAGGSGLSGAFGLAANTNGETFRVGNPEPTLYLGRGYIAQTLQLGKKGVTDIEESANETGGLKPNNYIKFYLGKMCLGDLFDNSAYANSPRNQFMNWCLMNNGAWDYAANVRGYTYLFAVVVQQKSMTYKAALATLPTVANGPDLNTDLGEEYSINAEADKTYSIGVLKRKGCVRLMAYYNNADMGNYGQALRQASIMPDVIATRQPGRSKTGIGMSADQQLNDNMGVFARAGWNDGKNETWCFTEADLAISAGLSMDGSAWHRKNDNIGIAVAVNGLTEDHRRYLAAGGLGFQLGDGGLNYANETAGELYYNFKPFSHNIWLAGDYQFVMNPGYNSARGPAHVLSIRVHVEL